MTLKGATTLDTSLRFPFHPNTLSALSEPLTSISTYGLHIWCPCSAVFCSASPRECSQWRRGCRAVSSAVPSWNDDVDFSNTAARLAVPIGVITRWFNRGTLTVRFWCEGLWRGPHLCAIDTWWRSVCRAFYRPWCWLGPAAQRPGHLGQVDGLLTGVDDTDWVYMCVMCTRSCLHVWTKGN